MDKLKNKIIAVLFGVIVILIMFRGCGDGSDPCPEVGTLVERDFVPYEVEVEVPVHDTIIRTNWVNRYNTLYEAVDSSNIINRYLDGISIDSLILRFGEERLLAMLDDYNSKAVYSDTISKEGDFLAIINDTIYQNRITGRQFFMQNLREDRVITIDNSRRRLLVGGSLMMSKNNYFDISPSIGFMNKRGTLIGYSYGVINKTHQVEIKATIKIK